MTRFFCCAILVGILCEGRGQAQPVPKISGLSREWFQRGTTNELRITGEHLFRAGGVHISGDPGVEVSVLPPKPVIDRPAVEASVGGIATGEGEDPNCLVVRVSVKPDASLNPRELRVMTSGGSSNPFRFQVSALPEVLEEREGANAQKLNLPVGVSGTISVSGEQDRYSIDARQGEDLVVDVWAFRMGSALDSSLVLRNKAGRELARSEDAKGFDSFLVFHVPEDGEYQIELRDFRYGGGDKHKYHLTVGALPYVESAFPLGARRGEAIDVTLKGVNLGDTTHLRLRPEANAPLGWQEIRVQTAQGLSSPFPFEVGDGPEMQEVEPNDSVQQANRISVPGVANGRIGRAKDVDFYAFKLEQARSLVCEVTAQRSGSPLDVLMTLQDATGKVLQQNDDAAGADARLEYAFEKDREYVLSIRDLLRRGGDTFVYRLAIRPPEPDFAVRVSPDNPRLACGGRSTLRCELLRKAGFAGAVRIGAAELPSGISLEPLLLSAEEGDVGVLTLCAATNAASGVHPLKLTATGAREGNLLSRTPEPMASNGPAKEVLLTVLDAAPRFAVDLTSLNLLLEQGQSGMIHATLARHSDFQSEVKLVPVSSGREPLSDLVDVQEASAKPGEARAALKLTAKSDAPPGARLLYLRAEATIDGQTVTEFSQAIPFNIRAVPFTLQNTMKRLSVALPRSGTKSAASEGEFAIRAARRGWFTDQINLAVEGLPDGVTVTSTNLPSHVDEVSFQLSATEKAPVGKEFKVVVVGSAEAGGRKYQERAAPMILSITPPSEEIADTK